MIKGATANHRERPLPVAHSFLLTADLSLKIIARLRSPNSHGKRSGIIEANALYHSLVKLESLDRFQQYIRLHLSLCE